MDILGVGKFEGFGIYVCRYIVYLRYFGYFFEVIVSNFYLKEMIYKKCFTFNIVYIGDVM